MIKQLSYSCAVILLAVLVGHAQQASEAPFSEFEKAVKQEPAGWAGDKSRLSKVFDAERKRLGDRFESELLKWLRDDPEKHRWISVFLEAESYLHGNQPLPHLSLLIKQQGLALVQGRDDETSRGYVVGFSITAAILSHELGFATLARFYKNEAEGLLLRQPELSGYVPGFTETDRRSYDEIKSAVSRKTPTVVGDPNPQPQAKVSGGVLNARALNKIKPAYSAAARKAGASGTVVVQIVFDETGKVIWARAVSGHPLLRQDAEDAAWQTKFPPTILSGEPVRTSGIMQYNFMP